MDLGEGERCLPCAGGSGRTVMTSMVGIVDWWLALGLAVGRARWVLLHGLTIPISYATSGYREALERERRGVEVCLAGKGKDKGKGNWRC